ncbi:MAG: gamma-glutamyltransferase [Alphaproteobacteria bacterium]|nr:gamma-glutamyltransferase [Alphaproteobacteria bacterium]MCY4497975.1 gamma-glutamyltransferase [Rhodospirillaceae bacterium]
MRFGKLLVPIVESKGRWGSACRQSAWALTCVAVLSACDVAPKSRVIEPGQVIEGFVGGVSADEPRAAVEAHEILGSGGTAVDAAVALTFALSVTYPIAASLGGGGVCLVYDAPTGKVEAVDFLPHAPVGGGVIAVPSTVRGMAVLHGRYGRLPWDELVAPAEALARRGHPVSRALVRRLEGARDTVLGNAGLRATFGADNDRGIVREGDQLTQIALSAVLAQIRRRGPGEFYAGQAGVNLVNGARENGGALTLADMRTSLPTWRDSVSLRVGRLTVHTTPAPLVGGVIAGQIWAMTLDENRLRSADLDERPHLFAEASSRAYLDRRNAAARLLSGFRAHALMRNYRSDRHTPLVVEGVPPVDVDRLDTGTTSFVVGDREGSAVACSLTMGRELGAGRLDPVTGIVLVPPLTEDDLAFLATMIVVDEDLSEMVLAISASGHAAGPAAIAQALIGLSAEDLHVRQQLNRPRILLSGQPDAAVVEPGIGEKVAGALTRRGHALEEVPFLGRVNAIYCQGGLSSGQETCEFMNDRRGFGLALGEEF